MTRSPTRHDATCRACGCRLSRYAPAGTVYCAPHEPARLTHDEYTSLVDTTLPLSIPIDEQCKRGHDLRIHGRLRNVGHGRIGRQCGACENTRKRAYRATKKETTCHAT